MGYLSKTDIERVQNETDIVDYIGSYIALKKQGQDYIGLCPFHGEKTPSFHVSAKKQVFHCFGCGKSGNLFQFAQYYHNESFIDAVKEVAQFSKIHLEENHTQEESAEQRKKQPLLAWHKKAKEIYHHLLMHTKEGKQARDYLASRGIDHEVMESFQLGYAPDLPNIEVLVEVFKENQLSEKEYEESGLFTVDYQGRVHDRFKGRLMIPIFDKYGQCIAFSGRLMTEDKQQSKYLNSKETAIFNKKEVLFHFSQAIEEIKQKRQVILLEGYMDVIALHQAGIENTVASMGTSLTEEQIQQFRRYQPEVIISYDGDSAGIKATIRAIRQLEQMKLSNIRIALLPDNKDPDEYLRHYGKEKLQHYYQNQTLSKMDFFLWLYKQNRNLQREEDKAAYLKDVLKELSKEQSIVDTDLYIHRLADELTISDRVLYEQLNRYKAKKHILPQNKSFDKEEVEQITESVTPIEYCQRVLLKRIFQSQLAREFLQYHHFYFQNPLYESLYLIILDYCNQRVTTDEQEFYQWLDDEEQQTLFSQVMAQQVPEQVTEKELYDCLLHLQRLTLDQLIQEKQKRLTEASRMGDKETATTLSMEVIDLLKKKKEGELQDDK